MIVFGWGGGRPKDRGAAIPVECPHCGSRQLWHYVTSTKWFRVYFIPIIPYENRHLLMCPICTNGIELSGRQIEAAKGMVQMTASVASGQIQDGQYVAAVEAFWKGDVPPQLAQRPPMSLPSHGMGQREPEGSLSLEAPSQGMLFSSDAESPPQRPCPHCREQMAREDRRCGQCGKKSVPWTLYEGRWWYRDNAGDAWWLDDSRNEWVKYT